MSILIGKKNGMQASKRYQESVKTHFFLSLRAAGETTRLARGVEFGVDGERMRIEFLRPDVVRLKVSHGGVFDEAPTRAVVNDSFGPVPFAVGDDDMEICLDTGSLRVVVRRKPFSIDIFRADGGTVMQSVEGRAYGHLNGRWCITRKREAGDGFFGLGQKTGTQNRSGRVFRLWNTDVLADVSLDEGLHPEFDPYYISIPFLYHVAENGSAAGSFIDNGYRLHYDLSRSDSWTVTADGGQLTEYIFAGPSVPAILRRYTELTGRMAPPPLWALGHHQCRWHDYREEDVLALARTYREKRLPCDVLWLDIDYMDDFRIFTWDGEKFPDPAALMGNLGRDGFRLVTIIDPGVKHDPGFPVYDEGVSQRLFCRAPGGSVFVGKVWPGHTVFPDFVNPRTRAWWSKLIARHAESGLGGIWIDMNEPAMQEVDECCMRFDCGRAEHEHERWHNQYGLLMAQATVEGLRELRPGIRPFVLSRAGFAGIQRHAANWMGDNGARWEQLALSVAMCCGMGISGQPFVGSDIGGFAEDTTEELLVRWYQYAAFQPFCRNHSMKGACDQYPWSFGEAAESRIRAALETRYRLLPYLYSVFMRSTETGEPVQRPLLFDFQQDSAARAVNDQFLCGPHLLVAPVVTPGTTERRVYLPRGGWYVLDTPGCVAGGREITVPAPLDSGSPVHVRAGAVIPEIEPIQSTAGYAPEEVILTVYLPEEDGEWESMLHEDDGISERWRQGAFVRTTFRLVREGDRVVLHGMVSGGGFPEFRRERFRIRVIGETVSETVIPNAGKSFSLELGMLHAGTDGEAVA